MEVADTFHTQDAAVGVLGYYLFGYAFAYGDNQACDSEGVCSSVQNGFIGQSSTPCLIREQSSRKTFALTVGVLTDDNIRPPSPSSQCSVIC